MTDMGHLPARVAVTGGAGFIGSHTVDALVERGCAVLVIDDMTHPCGHDLPDNTEILVADCGSEEAAQVLASFAPDAVLHLAAKGGVARALRDPGAHVRAGLASTVALFAAASAAGARRLVTASSGGTVYGNAATLPAGEDLIPAPRSPYGAGKLCEEIYLGAFGVLNGISGMALRYGNVYGPRQDGTGEAGVVAISCWRLAAGDPAIIYGDGTQERDFVYVEDVAEANVAALASTQSGPVNIGTGVSLSIRTVVDILCRLYDSKVGWKLGPSRDGEVRRTCLGPARAWEWLGWSPSITMDEGLRRTQAHFANEARTSTPAA